MASLHVVDVEESIQNALEALRSKAPTQQIATALEYLAPEGYHPVVKLQEDGRKKRRTASADNWAPETGEILISFSRDSRVEAKKRAQRPPSRLAESLNASSPANLRSPRRIAVETGSAHKTVAFPEDSHQREVCAALEEVERQGRAFVALKWFRDEVLPSKFAWAARPENRQAALTRTIEAGMIVTNRIPNPHSPFPTTAVRLNRSAAACEGSHRFAPIKIHGEPLSATLLRDRGER